MAWIIDDKGTSWAENAGDLSAALGTTRRGADLTQYLVGKMGFVGVQARGQVLEVEFEPTIVNPIAVVGLLQFLADRMGRPVAFKSPRDEKQVMMMRDWGRVASYLSGIIEARRPRPSYAARLVPTARSIFGSRVNAAHEILSAPIGDTTRAQLLDALFDGHVTLNRFDPVTNHYRVLHISETMRRYDPLFVDGVQSATGPTYHQLADPSYGTAVANCLKLNAGSEVVKTELVDATIEFATGPKRRVSYTRLAVPFGRGSDRMLMVASSIS